MTMMIDFLRKFQSFFTNIIANGFHNPKSDKLLLRYHISVLCTFHLIPSCLWSIPSIGLHFFRSWVSSRRKYSGNYGCDPCSKRNCRKISRYPVPWPKILNKCYRKSNKRDATAIVVYITPISDCLIVWVVFPDSGRMLHDNISPLAK